MLHDGRYDWAYLFGAACPQRRVAAGLVMPPENAEALSLDLTAIGRKVATGSHAALNLEATAIIQRRAHDHRRLHPTECHLRSNLTH